MTMPQIARSQAKFAVAGFLLLQMLMLPASAFQLQSIDASRVNLNDYVGGGKWTLVMLWSLDCIACEEQKPIVEAFHQRHGNTNARAVGIATDGHEHIDRIQKLVDLHDPSYPTLVAFSDVFTRQFKELTGADYRVSPTYLVYSPDGQLAGRMGTPVDWDLLEKLVVGKSS